jgi:hypothetical protein
MGGRGPVRAAHRPRLPRGDTSRRAGRTAPCHPKPSACKLDRIEDVELSPFPFTRPPDFSRSRHLKGSFGVYRGDGDCTVTVRSASPPRPLRRGSALVLLPAPDPPARRPPAGRVPALGRRGDQELGPELRPQGRGAGARIPAPGDRRGEERKPVYGLFFWCPRRAVDQQQQPCPGCPAGPRPAARWAVGRAPSTHRPPPSGPPRPGASGTGSAGRSKALSRTILGASDSPLPSAGANTRRPGVEQPLGRRAPSLMPAP